jgi:two-component system, sensor histidine kinase and response regulator
VALAENGAVALEMARTRSYDLVFMDMQMPVMDGVAATQAIRRFADAQALPIVAMTANAMEQDRRRCFDAGMNDYVSKPIDPAQLAQVLERWLAMPRGREASAAPGAPPVVSPPQLPTGVPGLDTQAGLARVGGKTAVYLALLQRFCQSQGTTVHNISDALHAGNRAAARILAHTLHGVAGNIGAVSLQELAGSLEQRILGGAGAADLAHELALLGDQVTRFVSTVEAFLSPSSCPAGSPVSGQGYSPAGGAARLRNTR